MALIGPNGAGKTTLMSCMIGDRFIDRGKILIDGKEPRFKDNKKKIGVLMQENVIPKDLKVLELIKFFQEIYTDSLTTDEVIKILCFTDKQLNQLAGKLSGGQKRLLAFVLCLVGKPEISFFISLFLIAYGVVSLTKKPSFRTKILSAVCSTSSI